MKTGILGALATLLAIATPANAAPATPDPVETVRRLAKQAIAYRQALGDAKVTLRIRYLKYKQQPDYEKLEQRATIWAKGTSLRTDLEEKSPTGRRLQQLVGTDDYFIDTMVSSVPARFNRSKNPEFVYGLFHPRILGKYPWNTLGLGQFNVGDLLAAEGQTIVDPKQMNLSGSEAWTYTSTFEEGAPVSWWLDPKKGPAPVRLRFVSQGKDKIRGELEVQLSKYGRRGIWYPNKVLYRTWSDDILDFEQETVTENADFDGAIAESIFRLEALGLSKDRAVLIDNHQHYTWNGRELVATLAPLPHQKDPDRKEDSTRWYYAMLSAAFLGLASWLLLRYIKRPARRRSVQEEAPS